MRAGFLVDQSDSAPRNEPWPVKPHYLLVPEPALTPRRVLYAIALLIAFVAGFTYGSVATRRAVAVEEMLR